MSIPLFEFSSWRTIACSSKLSSIIQAPCLFVFRWRGPNILVAGGARPPVQWRLAAAAADLRVEAAAEEVEAKLEADQAALSLPRLS